MTLHVFPNVEQRSDEWFDQRRGIVTASVVGSLISIGRQTAADFDCPECAAAPAFPCIGKRGGELKAMHTERAEHARKNGKLVIEPASNDTSRDLTIMLAAERITGYTEPTYLNDDMYRGIDEEPRARQHYAEHYASDPVTEVGFMVRDFDGARIGYSPDGLVGDDGLLEIKSPRQKSHLRNMLAGTVPSEYMAQLQAGLLVSGRKWIDFLSWNGGMPTRPIRVYPQQDWFRAIYHAVRAFEDNAAEIIRLWSEAVDGLPMTERRVYTLNPDVEIEL